MRLQAVVDVQFTIAGVTTSGLESASRIFATHRALFGFDAGPFSKYPIVEESEDQLGEFTFMELASDKLTFRGAVGVPVARFTQ